MHTIAEKRAPRPAHEFNFSPSNGKIGRIWNYSTIPGAEVIMKADGTPAAAVRGTCAGCCEGTCERECYARRSVLQYTDTARAWAENTLILRGENGYTGAEFSDGLRKLCERIMRGRGVKALRYHVSGEFETHEEPDAGTLSWEFSELCAIAAEYPEIVFFGYSKRVGMVENYAANGCIPSNLIVNLSEWGEPIANPFNFSRFIYDDGTRPELESVAHCPAVRKDGTRTGITCEKCMRCASRTPHATAVYAH